MPAVVLDSEALSRLASGHGSALEEVRLVLTIAAKRAWPVRVPSVVLAELYRSQAAVASVDAALSRFGIRPLTTGQRVARHAGRMLGRDGLDSCHLADAIVVATAIRAGGGVIPTGDPDDIAALAADEPNIKVRPL
jgi:predicted nucleic acid-binding protein